MIKTWDEFITEDNSKLIDSNSEIISEGSSDDSSYMALTNLKKIHHMVGEIISKMPKGYVMDRWAEDHIATSADDIDEVYTYLIYGENFADPASHVSSTPMAPEVTSTEEVISEPENVEVETEEETEEIDPEEKEEVEDEIEDEDEEEEEEEMNEE